MTKLFKSRYLAYEGENGLWYVARKKWWQMGYYTLVENKGSILEEAYIFRTKEEAQDFIQCIYLGYAP